MVEQIDIEDVKIIDQTPAMLCQFCIEANNPCSITKTGRSVSPVSRYHSSSSLADSMAIILYPLFPLCLFS